ncbi:cyanidin 3-O-galactoside 2''-O-xylosyltransferase FGGT1-like [Rhododendron vialii]|uniref:cyanidin 3-O-galactoside 2''-O-xylosyltransferase FGGT1-like n=1 Tax=Rhododendron vialii TaxID=182163 RepID=UPI00265E15C6|nr:cyanidin 3-O-galactoside 2''-O-xylosyltransferase FGGT1-like [Rhododendron vialii]XP_058226289.1 cyanidin 3-O-galactoside 2''-O-xylosyltransferase FGGT1-like [Rhododendron vialii]XP_058226290.1 cyanidin 3-O-galactoside 2''-O-xylosyltransferase FGGT1-like [Rhododendron vialii]
MSKKTFQVAMLPWFAMGHLIPYINISNKLAQRGHRISFFIPTNTIPKFDHLNLHPDLITFIPVTVPHVDGLPHGAETTTDVSYVLHPLIMTAMDLTQPSIEASLKHLKPHFVFFDLAHWIPALARRLGIKSVHYSVVSPAASAYLFVPGRKLHEKQWAQSEFMKQPPGYPASSIKLASYEALAPVGLGVNKFGSGITFAERLSISRSDCDAISFKTCTEIEGRFCDYIEKQYKKTVILAGPVMPDPPPAATLEERWEKWLGSFEPKTVIFCSLGSECRLGKEQFQELVLGLELSGMPFFAALKLPLGAEKIENILPTGFLERTQGRGIVYGGWVQQQLILAHSSVGCNVTHCGYGSLLEAVINECELVLIPQYGDQIINSRLMSGDLEVGVEVERDKEDGLFTSEGVCKAIRLVMEVDSEVGKKVRANRAKLSEFLSRKSLDSSYIDSFVQKLQGLLGMTSP